jgi:hypothetical protein
MTDNIIQFPVHQGDDEQIVPTDRGRIESLGERLVAAIDAFSAKHHVGEVTVATANVECLIALAEILAFRVSVIECADCRDALAGLAQDYLADLLQNVVEDGPRPADPPVS